MSNAEYRKITREFLLKKVPRISEITDEADLFESGLVNSVFAMLLVQFVEDTWNVTVEEDELTIKNFSSVAIIAAFVEKKLGA